MKEKTVNLIFLAVPFLIFGGEYVLKNRIEEKEKSGPGRKILGGTILVRKYHNHGAVLDLGEKRSWLVAAMSLVLTVLLSMVFAVTLTGYGSSWLRAGLSVLLGGAFSNTYDRLKRKYVVDYFSFGVKWEPLRRVVFNLSDFCILIGSLILVLKA